MSSISFANTSALLTLRMARKAGMTNAHGIAAEYTGPTLPHYMIREAACIAVDALRGSL